MNERFTHDYRVMNGGSASGWYPDPDDTGGLRFWDGNTWSEHRARLSAPSSAPAVCSCGVAAIGRCRMCTEPYCRAHISATTVDDRAFRKKWEPWTCGNCIEDGQREIRADQLARCENVTKQMTAMPKLRKVKTPNGKHPTVVNLFQHPRKPTERPPRYAEAFLIEYDGGSEAPTYEGLALSLDGTTVYKVGLPVTGVPKDRFGPKRNLTGFIVKNEVNVELLTEAATRSTSDSWFEYSARSFLRAARHIGVTPDFSLVFPTAEEALAALEEADSLDADSAIDEIERDDSDEVVLNGVAHHGVEHNGEVLDIHTGEIREIHSVEVERDTDAEVQLQAPVMLRQLDPPLSPPLPLPHPTM